MNPLYPTLLLSLAALILLIIITFSAPFVPALYFLQATVPGDVIRFGIWGYCFQYSKQCSPKALGYKWDPEIIPWMTKMLVFHPIAAIITLLAVISLIPSLVVQRHRDTIFPPPLYSLLSIPATITSMIASAFTIALATVTRDRFHKNLENASYGPLPWISIAATAVLFVLMVYTGCGVTWRGPFGQTSPHIRNRWSAVYTY